MSRFLAYQDRRIDVLVFQSQPDADVQLQQLFSPENGGEVVTGAIKLAQRWLLEFLTIRGSMPFLPERGSSFIAAARQGRLRTEADVLAEFDFAADEIRQSLIAEEPADMPDDERYGNVTLDQLLLTEDAGLALRITILSVAGAARSVILPIPVSTLATPV